MNRVVITGIGIYSCIGKDLAEVTQSLYDGKSGIWVDPARKEMGYRSGLTGKVEKPSLKGVLDRRARIMLPEQGEYAFMSTTEALKSAGLEQDYIDQREIGIIFGNDSSAQPVIEATDIIREKKDTMLIGSGSVPELNCKYESGYHLPVKGYKLYRECCVCQWFACYRFGYYVHQEWYAGLHHLRRSTRDQ
jgi:3-oxoacyl-[acyl-carrier-protein] synthase-1